MKTSTAISLAALLIGVSAAPMYAGPVISGSESPLDVQRRNELSQNGFNRFRDPNDIEPPSGKVPGKITLLDESDPVKRHEQEIPENNSELSAVESRNAEADFTRNRNVPPPWDVQPVVRAIESRNAEADFTRNRNVPPPWDVQPVVRR